MRQLSVDEETYDMLAFAARISGTSVQEIVTRLVREHTCGSGPEAGSVVSQRGEEAAAGSLDPAREAAVYVVYRGRRVEGVFDIRTGQLRITTDPLPGRTFNSSSAAAIAVVEKLNPGREHPNTNGRTFW